MTGVRFGLVGVLGHSGSLLALLINIPANDNNLGPEDHHHTSLSPLTYKQSHIPHSFAYMIPNPYLIHLR
jgi:hypothetical protein